jgi:hypothetical protein
MMMNGIKIIRIAMPTLSIGRRFNTGLLSNSNVLIKVAVVLENRWAKIWTVVFFVRVRCKGISVVKA